ncbi:ATP-dependent RNA helicase [Wickerhamomyces ciferrii]|uniref:ATP-dependent RNA helicase n=1 Tax=Wickerhamomyces ciferrii (strain ATCC 14091 / BCRC 22168 / CBS 111 / JCM 3599 / NBRC 0793 / NRRL Y-1031 F-60-10) TaxID=1206466 RepID=K0KHE7_WICCF|nr:ATP-dependent RNA helicase [Wickerhamomyces ciferrii]CCH42436.1 ATP-dependent RNA helicase [Wickerhamomyces ciferrii]
MDDGLLLNFSTEASAPAPTKSSAKVVGGKWKDRRKAQLSARGIKKKDRSKSGVNAQPVKEKEPKEITTSNTETKPTEGQPQSRPVKKRSAPSENENKGPSKQARFTEGRGTAGKNDTYVSSLFTSNPELTKRDYNQEMEVHEPSNAPLADATSFNGLGLNEILNNHLTEHLSLKNPTKIQRSVLPRLLTRERDLFVQAQTGSGKTLAFVLPIFQKLMEIKDLNRTTGIFALILAPTRELATQIYSVIETLTRCCHRIVPGIVIGGEKKKSEKARLRKGVNILVATPGRLADHIEHTERLDLSNIRYVVLDEGDKLMELGFEETITQILTDIEKTSRINATIRLYPTLPHKRINVLCSATIKGNVKKLGEISLSDAEMVNNNSVPDADDLEMAENVAAPDQLLQQVCVVPPKLRLVSLAAILKNITSIKTIGSRTMIFLSCSDSVDFHFSIFAKDGKIFNKVSKEYEDPRDSQSTVLTSPLLGENTFVYKLHGSLSQQTRTATLSAFSKAPEDQHTILFCTDVASRGLDLPYISTVIEYDPPFATEDHLHRIGRTARAGKSGKSFLFLLPTEEKYLELIEHYHPNGVKHRSYEDLLTTGFGVKWDFDATTWHLNIERWLLEDETTHEKAVKGFTSHIRAYATHISLEKSIFNLKSLHLGHLAKSFGLRETPKKLGGKTSNNEVGKRKKENPKDKMFRMARMTAKAQSDEFNFM